AIDKTKHEVLVFLDGCDDNSNELLSQFPTYNWLESSKSIGVSPARRILFEAAQGEILIGFDDDAHPLQQGFIDITKQLFLDNQNVAVLSFEEIKGIYDNDHVALMNHIPDQSYLCNSFVGCGFAIRNDIYKQTAGFPEWMDIYGEEGCLSIEIIDKGYGILYTSEISVNHRVDRQYRQTKGGNVFRFERQLCNMALYFLVFYPANRLPRKWIKLFWHNFKKYALTDFNFFKAYVRGVFRFLLKVFQAWPARNPVSKSTVKKINSLPHPKYG
ncbi:MAG: glycosyltransferase family 2 protein, partial [Leeuwenhoekiella sp.]